MAALPPTVAGPRAPVIRRHTGASWVLGAVGLLPVLAYLVAAVQRVGYPYELTYFEGSTVEVMARVVGGQPLYAAPTTEWTPWPYPPLYFWVSAALAHVTGVSLLPMRLVSLAASLAVLVLVALVVRRFSGSAVAGLVAAGLFAATYRVSGVWFDTARVDSLLLALLLLAVSVGMRVTGLRGGVVLGLVLFLGFLTKQNTLIVAAPMLLWLLVRRRPVGVGATLTLGVTVVGSTLLGDLVSDGWYSRYVVHQLTSQAWAPQWFTAFWVVDLALPFAVSLLTVLVGLVLWWRRGGLRARRADRRLRLPGDEAAYLLACVVGLVGTSWAARLHEGGYANVSMPAQAALAIVVGCLLGRLLQTVSLTRGAVTGLALLVVVQAGVMAAHQPTVLPTAADRATGDRFVGLLQRLPGRVLVPTHPYYLRMAGLPTHASAIAIYDIYRSGGGPELLRAVLPWSLDGVSAVVLDNPSDVGMFGPSLTRDFTLVTPNLVPPGVFAPISDLPAHPTVLYVRTSELASLPASATSLSSP